jgi:hypothetical protein
MELQGSSSPSQKPLIGSYLEPVQPSLLSHISDNLISFSCPRLCLKWSFPSWFSIPNGVCISQFTMQAICPAHLILHYLIAETDSHEQMRKPGWFIASFYVICGCDLSHYCLVLEECFIQTRGCLLVCLDASSLSDCRWEMGLLPLQTPGHEWRCRAPAGHNVCSNSGSTDKAI